MKIYFHYDLKNHDILSSLVLNQYIFDNKHELYTNKFPNNFFKNNKKIILHMEQGTQFISN